MTAPLVTRLEAELRESSDPARRAEIVARIACYQARVGDFAEARRARDELRRDFGDGRSPSVSILIMCLEAMLLYFSELDSSARDRLVRANLLSVAFDQQPLIALTSAWQAHVDFNQARYESMAAAVTRCLDAIDADDGTALCRISLVLGDSMLFVNELDSSRRWYEQARIAANRLGDQAAVGAITYNRAALHVASARLRSLNARLDKSEIAIIGAEVRTAINYQDIAQLSSLDHLLRSAGIGVLMLEERFEEASAAILKLLASSAVPGESAELSLLYADNAHCLTKIGKLALADQMAAAALSGVREAFDADDRARIFGSLAQSNAARLSAQTAQTYQTSSREALLEHQATIARLHKLLQPFVAGPTTAH